MKNNKIAFFDIDGTIFKGNIIEPLLDLQVEDNLLEKSFADEIHNLHVLLHKGEITRDVASKKIVETWAMGLKGKSYQNIFKHTEDFIKNNLQNFYSFTKPLLKLIKKTHNIILTSNEPQFVCEVILNLFGLTNVASTIFEVKSGVFTGKVIQFNSTLEDKKNSAKKFINQYNFKQSFAFGDSITDVGILDVVENSICVNPSKELQEYAEKKGWIITNSDNVLNLVNKIFSLKY
ncbi:MAG: haloacid dehalogenase-like hydrolase [Ignavibacteriaceae bacterium]|nr:haloacid dehalogenase-like hydrolase [Ignavibacteriaceae bacterium]